MGLGVHLTRRGLAMPGSEERQLKGWSYGWHHFANRLDLFLYAAVLLFAGGLCLIGAFAAMLK